MADGEQRGPDLKRKVLATGTKLLVVVVHPADELTDGGIILIPGGTSGRKLVFGRIVSAGPAAVVGLPLPAGTDALATCEVKGNNLEGIVVIFERNAGAEFRMGASATHFLLDCGDVLGTLEVPVEEGDKTAPKIVTRLS